jgi:PKD repeat protein
MSPPTANINEVVTFDASLTRDEGVVCGDNCTYLWDFGGDTKTKNGRIVTQSFPTASTGSGRTIRLTVTDSRGFSASKSQQLKINAPDPPVANFVFVPTQPKVNQTVTFDSTSFIGIGTTIVSYVWDFNDGTPLGSGKTATHSYTQIKDPLVPTTAYSVTLTITDDLGRVSQKSYSVLVTN